MLILSSAFSGWIKATVSSILSALSIGVFFFSSFSTIELMQIVTVTATEDTVFCRYCLSFFRLVPLQMLLHCHWRFYRCAQWLNTCSTPTKALQQLPLNLLECIYLRLWKDIAEYVQSQHERYPSGIGV